MTCLAMELGGGAWPPRVRYALMLRCSLESAQCVALPVREPSPRWSSRRADGDDSRSHRMYRYTRRHSRRRCLGSRLHAAMCALELRHMLRQRTPCLMRAVSVEPVLAPISTDSHVIEPSVAEVFDAEPLYWLVHFLLSISHCQNSVLPSMPPKRKRAAERADEQPVRRPSPHDGTRPNPVCTRRLHPVASDRLQPMLVS
jgi:hypothetical protein